ncbi:head-tail connector protein [Geomicrobium sp. JCM 19038]|uniref:head-tail connector protein n=1 Tax=Geomicrobium sp. JCM 19038 TaxID=1460635 RepID=UPI00045F2DD2|nr:head-tail connector protein [Geomicrobium sp. JCM 19038]GAK08997.1 hypothetical protein JCM19038_2807 [Geomicrobium sp. JCM 19038]
MDLELLKGFLRIDGSEDDEILAALITSAKNKMLRAGVPEPKDEGSKAQYDIAIMMQVKLEYDPLTGIEIDRLNKAITGTILQLREYGGERDSDIQSSKDIP